MGLTDIFIVLAFFLPVAICFLVAIQAWNRRRLPGSAALSMLMINVLLYSVPYFLQITSHDLNTALLWHYISIPGIALVTPSWLIFALRYSGNERWFGRRFNLSIVLLAALNCFTAWTNPWLGLSMRDIRLVQYGAFSILEYTHGWSYWVFVTIYYGLTLLGMVLIVKSAILQFKTRRRQAVFLLLGALIPLISHLGSVLKFSRIPGLDLTTFSFALTGLLWGYGIFHYKLRDVVPLAREVAMEQMKTGVIILDGKEHVIDLNPAARFLLTDPLSPELNKPLDEMASYLVHGIPLDILPEVCIERAISIGGEERWLEVRVSPIDDLGGKRNGTILLLQDITERKQTEALLKESEEKFRAVLHHLQDGIAVADLEGRLVTWNSRLEDMLGLPVGGLQGKTIWDLKQIGLPEAYQNPRLDRLHRERLLELSKASDPTDRQLTIRNPELKRPDGSTLAVDVHIFIVPTSKDAMICVLVHDITKFLASELSLKQANERLTDWLNNMEMRNRQGDLLNEFGARLLGSIDEDEVFEIAEQILSQLFDGQMGGIYLFDRGANRLERRMSWGNRPLAQRILMPPAYLSVKERDSHLLKGFVVGAEDPFRQKNNQAVVSPFITLCTPLVHHEDTLGVLLVHYQGEELEARMKQLSRAIVDRLTLTLTNLRLRDTLRDLSIRDPLTNLYNRRFMQEALDREMSRAVRRNHAMSLIMMDIDHFKNFNDSYGHAKGDEILKMLAEHLVRNTRKEDFACRFGGEEFLIVLPDTTPAQALARAEELRSGISKMQAPVEGSEAQSITVSVGVAGYPHNGDTIAEVMEAADFALYRAKAKGRNCVVQARG